MKIKTFYCKYGYGVNVGFSKLDTRINKFLQNHTLIKMFVSESITDLGCMHTITVLYDE